MKKIIAIIISVLLLISTVSVAVFAVDEALELDVVTDAHYSYSDSVTPIVNNTPDNLFGHNVSNGKLIAESRAILEKFLENAKNDKSEFVVFTGDITDNGSVINQSSMAEILTNFEKSSGKTVICAIGNHETYQTGDYSSIVNEYASQFKVMYKDLGYDKALAVDENSASYTVDLKGDYRLICIDCNYFNQARFDWIEKQALQAKKDGKKLISVTHFPIFDHYIMQALNSDNKTLVSFDLKDKFIEWGIRFNLSGHIHEHDIASYSNDNGTVYDITTGSLTTYPSCYRTLSFNKQSVKIDTEYINEIDYSYVPEGLCKEAEALLKTNYRKFSKDAFVDRSSHDMKYFINVAYLVRILKLDATEDKELIDILSKVIGKVNEVIDLPLYGENSISSLGDKYGYEIPESNYNSVMDIISNAYAVHCAGNEDSAYYTPFGKLTVNAVSTVLTYALDGITAEEYSTVLNFVLTKVTLPVEISEKVVNLASNMLTKTESIRVLMQYVAVPVFNDFLCDSDVNEATVTLANYGYSQENETLLGKIGNFFNKFLEYLNLLFTFITNMFG